MRASLSDLATFGSAASKNDNEYEFKPRERAPSNEKFDLPPLPDMDDNKDLMELDQPEQSLNDNYRSNEKFSCLAAVDENDFAMEVGADLGRLDEFGLEAGASDNLDLGLDDAGLDLREDDKKSDEEVVPEDELLNFGSIDM